MQEEEKGRSSTINTQYRCQHTGLIREHSTGSSLFSGLFPPFLFGRKISSVVERGVYSIVFEFLLSESPNYRVIADLTNVVSREYCDFRKGRRIQGVGVRAGPIVFFF